VFCRYRCGNFAGGVLPDRAALATDCVAKLAMTSRRRSFCFLNLLNLALSPCFDDICPRSSNLLCSGMKRIRHQQRNAVPGENDSSKSIGPWQFAEIVQFLDSLPEVGLWCSVGFRQKLPNSRTMVNPRRLACIMLASRPVLHLRGRERRRSRSRDATPLSVLALIAIAS
jgi:hypothetical protein